MHFSATKFSLKNGLLLHTTHGGFKKMFFNKLMMIHPIVYLKNLVKKIKKNI